MSRAVGDEAETLTCHYLLQNGFEIIERNFYSRFGEIDVIARKSDVLHFIEVKSGLDYERAVQNITPKKIAKILKTVDVYLKKHALTCNYQVDAVIVSDGECVHIESITL
ncbi:MAG: YraN family protein [Campylobacterota bacterium]|nr:YraN family protein [Campylobacterota bacterium]